MSVNIVLKTILDDKGIKNAQKAFGKLGSTVKTLGASLGVALGTRAFIESARAAAEDAKSQSLLATQLRNTISANDDLIASVEQSINKMSMSAAVADDVLRPAFGQLVRATGDVAKANELVQLALDVSAGTGRDLQSVSIALSKAYQGNTTALSRLGIKVEDGADAFAVLQEQFKGAAETAARNDPFQRLSVTVGELQEQIGAALLPQINGLADYLATAEFGEAFSRLAISIGNVITQINNLGNAFSGGGLFTGILDFLARFGDEISKRIFQLGAVGEMFKKFFTGDWVGLVKDVLSYPTRYLTYVNSLRKELQTLKPYNPIAPIDPNDPKGLPKQTESQFKKVQKIIKTYQEKLFNAEQEYIKTRFELNADYNKAVANLEQDAAEKRADIVQQSIDRLRNAFRSATQIGLSDLFKGETETEIITSVKKLSDRLTTSVTTEVEKTTYSSVDSIINGLAGRLAASRKLLENASALASKGFSQTFIEQVVETGADTGNALANAILGASPEQQAALKKNFLELEDVSETGMDAIARSIYDRMGLATRELKAQNEAVNAELTEALKLQYEELQKSLADAGYAFTVNVQNIKTEFEDVIDSLDGKFGGLKKTIDELKAKMAGLAGGAVTDIQAAITAPGTGTELANAQIQNNLALKDVAKTLGAGGIVIDSAADVAGAMAYLQARIEAGNKYLKANKSDLDAAARVKSFASELQNLKAASAAGTAAGTIVNINVKTDTTQSAAMVGKTIGKVVSKYTTTGGRVLVSGG